MRKKMINRTTKLSANRHAGLLGMRRRSVYYRLRPVFDVDPALMHRVNKLPMELRFSDIRLVVVGLKVRRQHVASTNAAVYSPNSGGRPSADETGPVADGWKADCGMVRSAYTI